ncbi:HAUS augmin-like complex subunit 4 [Pleurodeles waltl]|uniref:HAUS augmin-like complex subunit 4 n=1 Tax=Pleurodeles waltl TaxID=8319 RepID=UPI0037099A18
MHVNRSKKGGTRRHVTNNNFLVPALQETKDYTQEESNATEKEKPCGSIETETAVRNADKSASGADETAAIPACREETKTRDARHDPGGSWLSKDVQQMREKLQKELEATLEEKCISLLTFHQPETNKNCDLLKSMKSLQLVERRLQSESEKCKANAVRLEKQKMAFPPVLLRCLSLLQTMATKFRLSAQADANRWNVDYWNKKCDAFSIKIRLEKLQVLIDTYTPEKLEVHRIIRSSLEKAILVQEHEVMTSRMLLHPHESLGPEFELIVKEYTRLKEEIATNKWSLEELCKSNQ